MMPHFNKSKKTHKAKEKGYRSNFEYEVAKKLSYHKVDFEYESLKLDYTITKTYTPDFVLPNGIIVEAKGYWSPTDRQKILTIIEQHPELDLRMVFQKPHLKISKRSKTTYAKFCDRKGIKWAAYSIPSEWVAEKK
jgi:hypothetical protein